MVSASRLRALEVVHRHGTAAVSNTTDPDRGQIHHSAAHRLLVEGLIEQTGFNRHNQALVRLTGHGIEALDHRRSRP